MNKDYTNLSIKRSLDSELREIAVLEQRTPQGMIAFWVKEWNLENPKGGFYRTSLATQPKVIKQRVAKGDQARER